MPEAPAPRRYWFPAKRHGWGWGPPSTWQGWLVLVAYVALVLAGVPLIQVTKGDAAYLTYLGVLTLALLAICWRTGEPPGRAGRRR